MRLAICFTKVCYEIESSIWSKLGINLARKPSEASTYQKTWITIQKREKCFNKEKCMNINGLTSFFLSCSMTP